MGQWSEMVTFLEFQTFCRALPVLNSFLAIGIYSTVSTIKLIMCFAFAAHTSRCQNGFDDMMHGEFPIVAKIASKTL